MPENIFGHLKDWRVRAEKARIDAERQNDLATRQIMTGVAAGYERLVQQAELLLRNQTSRPPDYEFFRRRRRHRTFRYG
jgi:hypothetical protein